MERTKGFPPTVEPLPVRTLCREAISIALLLVVPTKGLRPGLTKGSYRLRWVLPDFPGAFPTHVCFTAESWTLARFSARFR